MRSRQAAENGPFAAREHGRHVTRLDAGRAMAHEIHAVVHPMQLPLAQAPLDRVATDTESQQLGAGHHPVLAGGDQGDFVLR